MFCFPRSCACGLTVSIMDSPLYACVCVCRGAEGVTAAALQALLLESVQPLQPEPVRMAALQVRGQQNREVQLPFC